MKIHVLLVTLSLLTPAAARKQRVVAISHLGEHLERPGNTLPAFKEAIRVNADSIEVDVQPTEVGQFVLSHDGIVDRCTNGTGKVSDMTFEQVDALDAGIKRGPSSTERSSRRSPNRSIWRAAKSVFTSISRTPARRTW